MIEFDDGVAEHHRECRLDFSDANFKGISTNSYYQQLKINYYSWQTDGIKFQFLKEGVTTYEVSIDNPNVQEYIQVWQQNGTSNNPLIPSKGDFNDTVTYHNYPVKATDFYALGHIDPNYIRMNLKIKYQGANTIENSDIYFLESEFKILDGITYNINYPNQFMVVGGGGKFITGEGTVINIPSDFYFYINGLSTVDLNGSTFQSYNSNSYWSNLGISLPINVKINRCIFKNAIDPLIIESNNYHTCIINDCEFNNYIHHGVTITNSANLVISNSHFIKDNTDPNSTDAGISIVRYSNSEEENNDNPNNTRIEIINNDFHFGLKHIITNSFGDNLLPIYIYKNTFEEGLVNLYLRNTVGIISGNTGTIDNTYSNIQFIPRNVSLYHSSPDFYNNTFISQYHNICSYNYSNPNLAPVKTENGNYFWRAGKNYLTTNNYAGDNSNIMSEINSERGKIFTDYGKNSFTTKGQMFYQIYAFLDMNCETDFFKTRCNEWTLYYNEPLVYLKDGNECEIPHIWEEPNGCDIEYQIIDRVITDIGNGFFDTVLITQQNNTIPPVDDIALFGSGINNQTLKQYSSAILNIKNLINNYPNSNYLERSIFDLYECYVASDTNHNQGWRNIIFTDLKNFLENKIQQYQNNDEFVNVSYDFLLKCKIKTKNYQQAMDGYDFIANNSPSATERLMASINYIDVEGLLQGSGSGMKETGNLSDELNSDQNGKPIKDILLASYKKTKDQIKLSEKNDLKNSGDVKSTKEDLDKKHKYEKKLEGRAKENISISGSLTKTERRERIQKDLMLLQNRGGYSAKNTKSDISVPLKYELSQNYPNPFNPITNIKYQIQKTGLVTLKIYDLLGREIKTLVNEVKNPGSYMVSFNGSEFASGVYFYRIQAGDFMQVRKMLMIK